MPDPLRKKIVDPADMIVVKIGTRVLTQEDGRLDGRRIASIAHDVCELVAQGRKVVVVSSGAVGAGQGELGCRQRPADIIQLQAMAAIGQTRLMDAYNQTLQRHGRLGGQVLLTAADLDHRARYLNVRNTLLMLLSYGAIPIVNENDTVAVDELLAGFGDNDRLAALVTNLLRASLLIILSDVDGLFDGDPRHPDARVIPLVERITDDHRALVRDRGDGAGKGGMASKLEAARMVTSAGENAIVANGHVDGILGRLMAGEPSGTLFQGRAKSLSPWKRWLGFSATPRGSVQVDQGAVRAITAQGRSLLAIGIREVSGQFEKGDVVSLRGPTGQEFARGLSNYAADDIRKIRGLQSTDIADVLAHVPYEEVIHRDNLLVLSPATGDVRSD